uniref:Uncharacterized protein n=1 Tax=Anopheles dirus TaxID=7168 RepID=A0A182NHI3_9DIPT
MAAYIVIPVIVLTMMAIWFMVYMYDKRLKSPVSSTSPPPTTCTNVRQEGIVYTISNAPTNNASGVIRPHADLNSATHIRGGPPPQYGFTSQNLIVVTAIPRDSPPSYDQATSTRDDGMTPSSGTTV